MILLLYLYFKSMVYLLNYTMNIEGKSELCWYYLKVYKEGEYRKYFNGQKISQQAILRFKFNKTSDKSINVLQHINLILT